MTTVTRWQFRGRVDTTAFSDAYRHRLESSRNISLGADLSADDVSIVIVLTPEDVFENKPPKWFQPELYNALTVSEPRYTSRGFSRKKDGAFTYRMLQKRAVATNGM